MMIMITIQMMERSKTRMTRTAHNAHLQNKRHAGAGTRRGDVVRGLHDAVQGGIHADAGVRAAQVVGDAARDAHDLQVPVSRHKRPTL